MPILVTEEELKWRALDSEARSVDDVGQFSELIQKLIKMLEDNRDSGEDFWLSDFIDNVGFKFNDLHKEFSEQERQDEMFLRCLRWFSVTLLDLASGADLPERGEVENS